LKEENRFLCPLGRGEEKADNWGGNKTVFGESKWAASRWRFSQKNSPSGVIDLEEGGERIGTNSITLFKGKKTGWKKKSPT